VHADAAAVREENVRVHAHASSLAEAYSGVNSQLSAAKSIIGRPLLRDFVISQAPDLVHNVGIPREPLADDRMFLSIITRTQGTRIRTLRDVLMCLAGQSCQDFELLIVVHNPTASVQAEAEVKALVAEFPPAQRQRIRVLTCTRAGRSAPLNDAASEANGQYIAFLDDDDFVFGHWVETFRDLARETPGAMLRAVCARQDFELAPSDGSNRRPRATSWFRMDWPATYDAVAHLHANFTPFMSLAFPAEAFQRLAFRFDETLSTTEDWDLANRLAMLCGVVTAPDVTSVYRWWTNAESSTFSHGPEEWDANRRQILQKLNSQPILLPPGTASRINQLIEREQALTARVSELERLRGQLMERNEWMCHQLLLAGIAIPWPDMSDQLQDLSNQILKQLLKSRSWRWTKPFRKLIQVLRGHPGSGLTADEAPLSFADCQRRILEVRESTSWRLTKALRTTTEVIRRFGPQ
jgi:GT2 family glycosyltransferase